MDKQHAKFILQSYRPDGADASNPDFAEALKVAAEDRELGSWLADERAHDAVFAEALSSVDIPEGLRDEIFAVMENDGGGKDLSSELDALFVGAMAHVTPPAGLRDQIISAMEVERDLDQKPEEGKIVKFPMRWLNLAAVAAVLVLGVTFILPGGAGPKASVDQLNLAELQVGSGRFLNASHEVDISNDSLEGVNTWLEREGMPVAITMPKGLISCDVKGGKKLILDNGVQASMILFDKKDAGEFYLMVLDVNSIEDAEKLVKMSEVKLKECYSCPVTHFNVTTWKDDTKAYMLLTKAESQLMDELF
ncbi:MAG: hypothetical protein ACSHX6_01670 [Akkermansiaceae bacterium]